ncbi:MAG: fatty acid hydroxylase family protein, partial [Actinobacteria bacterium]|nr:fatty acid hydroxylase family protein [Actinomycetota bacterium]
MRTQEGATQTGSKSTSLADEARFFWSHRNARLISAAFGVAVLLRVALAGWTRWDAVVLAALIAMEPFVEWMIHVFILHFKPREFLGRRIDPLVARKH